MERRRFVALLPASLLLGCFSHRDGTNPNHALLAPGVGLDLLKAPPAGPLRNVHQVASLKYDGQVMTMESYIQIADGRFAIVIMDGLGRRGLELRWTAGGPLEAELASWLPSQLRPGSLLADLMVIYWPSGKLRAALDPVGARLLESPRQRRVLVNAHVLAEADYAYTENDLWSGTTHYINRTWGYELDIESRVLAT